MTAIPQFQAGFRLVTGDSLNAIVDTVNALTGGTGAVSASSVTTGTLAVTGNSSIGNAVTDTVGFYGTTPAAQPAATAQSAVAATAITGPASTVATNDSTAWGYATSTQADAIVSAVTSLIAQGAALVALTNAMRSALVTLGIMKGSN